MYAVEMSGIAEQARQIVADNGYSERITLLQAKVEDITLPVAQVRPAPCWACPALAVLTLGFLQ